MCDKYHIYPENTVIEFIESNDKSFNEFEVRIGKKDNETFSSFLTRKDFDRFNEIISKSKNIGTINIVREKSRVYFSNNIRKIVTNNKAEIQRKTKINKDTDYYFFILRFSFAKEETLKSSDEDFKEFRDRDRISYKGVDFSIDLTEVDYKGKKSYELEFEFENREPKYIFTILKCILCEFYNANYIVGKDTIFSITEEWNKCFQNIKQYSEKEDFDWKLVENKPVDLTIERSTILDKTYNVTNKLDGKRKRIFIFNKANEIYITLCDVNGPKKKDTNSLKILYIVNTKSREKRKKENKQKIEDMYDIVLDGEYLEKGKEKFYTFDVLYYNDSSLLNKNFKERINTLTADYAKNIADIIPIYKKTFFQESSIYESLCKFLLTYVKDKRHKNEQESILIFSENNDGIIFTPILTTYITDIKTIKFKLVSKLSFDLYCKQISPNEFILQGSDKKIFKDFKGTEKHPINALIYKDKQNIIRNGMIVEFGFKLNGKNILLFFLKIRSEKKFANSFAALSDVWDSIHDPITIERLLSLLRKDEVENKEALDIARKLDEYQNNLMKTEEEKLALGEYNRGIEDKLLSQYIKQGDIVLDIGYGRGGSQWKYDKLQPSAVFGIEPDISNIEEAKIRMKKLKNMENRIFLLNAKGQDSNDIVRFLNLNRVDKVDVAVSIFSLSFFFDKERDLEDLMRTLFLTVKKDGYFIGITKNGLYISELVGKKYNFDENNYVEKLYTEYKPGFGNMINFKLSGTIISKEGHAQRESLVSLPILQKYLENIGFKLIEINKIKADLKEPEKTIVELSSSFVFKRINENINLPNQLSSKIIALPPNKSTVFVCEFLNQDFVRTGIIGDGSCLIHAIVRALYPNIVNLSIDDQKKKVAEIRSNIASRISKLQWFQLGYGQVSLIGINKYLFEEFEKLKNKDILKDLQIGNLNDYKSIIDKYTEVFNVHNISLDILNKSIDNAYNAFINYVKSNEWIGQELFRILMEYFRINLFFISDDRKPFNIYECDSYRMNRLSLIILNISYTHYEILGVITGVDDGNYLIKRTFKFQDNILFNLYKIVCPVK